MRPPTPNQLDLDASAVLLFLQPGEAPGGNFDPYLATMNSGNLNNPSCWWELRPALVSAMLDRKEHGGRLPWIKTGARVLSPEDIEKLYDQLPRYE